MEEKKIRQIQRFVSAPISTDSKKNQLLFFAARLSPVRVPLSANTVYIVEDPSELLSLPDTASNLFLLCCFDKSYIDMGSLSKRRISALFLGSGISPDEVQDVLTKSLQKNHEVAQISWQLLQEGNRGCTIGQMAEIVHQHTKNTVAVFGTGFQLLAFQGTPDSSAERWMQERYLSREDIERVNADNIHERARKSRVPILVQNKHFKYNRIVSMLDQNRDLGHVVLIEDKVPFTEQDYHIAAILSSSICQQMLKDEFIRNMQGFPHEHFLKDLLDHRLVNTPQNLNHTDFLRERFSSDCCCLVVETARTPGALSINLIRDGFEQIAPGTSTVTYNGQIIVIFSNIPSQGMPQQKLDRIRKFCIENGLYCGMSNPFANILDLADYYTQSLRAIELGVGVSASPNLFRYQDYFVQHLLSSFLRQEDASVFCCPQMKRLIECDKKEGRNLAETLYQYLLYGTTAATAAAMFIHRNTLLYRLNLINEIVSIDYNDPIQRLYLTLSYEMMQSSNGNSTENTL